MALPQLWTMADVVKRHHGRMVGQDESGCSRFAPQALDTGRRREDKGILVPSILDYWRSLRGLSGPTGPQPSTILTRN